MTSFKKVLKGYDKLYSTGELGKIDHIKLDFTNTPISSIDGKASEIIFGKATEKAELVTRQYLLMMFADLNFHKQILGSIGAKEGEAIFILPPAWRKILFSHGIPISQIKSRIAWNYFLLKFFLLKSLLICRTIFHCFLLITGVRKTNSHLLRGDYAYFFSLSKYALPQPDKKGLSHDFISWYINWDGRHKNILNIYHNVKESEKLFWKGFHIDYLDNPVIPSYTKEAQFKYGFWCFKALFVSVLNLIIGRWWNVLLLEEAMVAASFRCQKPELLAKEYYFNNSGYIYRPLWTYEAESKGAAIKFYFYSTNCETFAAAGRKTDFYCGYQTMNWPHYLVWDEYQARFVRNAIGQEARVSIVGPIWFSTSSCELPVLPNKTIAVFDVQPFREALYKTFGVRFDYYVPKVCNQFLSDIFDVCESLNYTMALKRKRDIGRKVHPAYRNFIKTIENSANFVSIDPDISAIKVIENSSLVISMPFTSTAILGRELNKPSVFYDPFNMVQKDDDAAHGIQIISGIDELYAWVNANV